MAQNDDETATSTKTAEKAPEPKPAPRRSPDEVAAELETARQSLVTNVDAIKEHLNPAHMVERRFDGMRRIFVSDEGKPNVRNIAVVASVVAVYVLYRIRR